MGLTARDGVAVEGTVTVRRHNADALANAAQRLGLDWDDLQTGPGFILPGKADIVADTKPTSEHTTTNATLVEFHEHCVDVFDPFQSTQPYTTTHLAVGTDGTAAASSDTGLGNEVDRVEVTWTEDRDADLFTSTLLDTNVANGETLREVALASADTAGDGIEFGRAIITDTPKDANETVTVEYTLTFA